MTRPIDDFALQRALERLPRSIEPPEDLWPEIRSGYRERTAARRRRNFLIRVAAGLAIVVCGAVILAARGRGDRAWRVATLAGDVMPERLRSGDTLLTGLASRALIEVGRIGHVEVEPGSRLRVLAARPTAQRMALDQGTIHARITAPPRLFIVETPAGTAVDLGCAYRLEVDHTGTGSIHVTLGWVAFERNGRQALVPGGMRLEMRTGAIGTPYADDAEPEFVEALQRIDFGDAGAGGHGGSAVRRDADSAGMDLDLVLRRARPRDAVTLWHLILVSRGADRERIVERLELLTPRPRGVTREAVLRLDDRALRLWWEKLPGTLPVVPSWTRTLWTLWLRLVG